MNCYELEMSDHDRRRGPHRRGGGVGPGRGRGGNNNNPRDTGRREEAPPTTPSPRPIILAKPDRDSPAQSIKQVDNAIIMVKTRDEGKPKSISPSELYRVKSAQSPSPGPGAQEGLTPQLRLALPAPMTQPVKVLDDCLQWSDAGLEFLLDQTDYLVIGVVGLENTGKSTVLSALAGYLVDPGDHVVGGNHVTGPVFPVRKTDSDPCCHLTSGLDMYVTSNRVILLDCQAVLSPSLLDAGSRQDRRGEYTSADCAAEVTSLQLTSLLYSVCHTVLVVQDWFTDAALLRFLLTAEMLRPSTPSSGQETNEDEFLPNLVLVVNKAERSDFSIATINSMTRTIEKCFEKSKLRHQGGVTMTTGTFPQLTTKTVGSNVNLFLLPWIQENNNGNDDVMSVLLPEYKGHPGFDEMVRLLRNQVFQLPRQPFTNSPLTERNWFHYTARMWESIKKSQLFADYSRLLP